MADFHNRLSDDTDYKRSELIRKIERAVERMSLSELEALSYDLFTTGYLEDCCCARLPCCRWADGSDCWGGWFG